MSRVTGLLAIIVPALLASCAPNRAPAPPPVEPAGPVRSTGSVTDRSAVVASVNAFGLDLYKRLGRSDRNLFLSPPSIATAVAMAHVGARSETAAEIARALHVTVPGAAFHREIGRLARQTRIEGEGRRVTVANALWVQSGFGLEADYAARLRDDFGAPPQAVDFRDAAAAARRINDWTKRGTGGRITELFSPASFTQDTRLVLANAVYLKADWLSPFKPHRTRPEPFHLASRAPVDVPFLNDIRALRHLDGDGFTAVALPYVGGELSMLVFLPDAASELARFERALDGASLDRWMRALSVAPSVPMAFAMPRLKLTTTYPLVADLQALGIARAFLSGADFSGISRAAPLRIDEVIHKTFLQVDEKGTEAAAVTGLEIIATGATRPPPLTFRADRPFFFVIRDERSGAALFVGRIVDPR